MYNKKTQKQQKKQSLLTSYQQFPTFSQTRPFIKRPFVEEKIH